MNRVPQTYCLVLHPGAENNGQVDIGRLEKHLSHLGLLGECFLSGAEPRYKLGEHFFQLLTFMGCAPALKLEPDTLDDEKFCHFHFVQYPQVFFRSLRPEVKARCPHCRKPGSTADEIRREYFLKQQDWRCPHCQKVSSPYELNWKHEAGMGRFFLELVDVYPHEVVPTDCLLKELETFSGHDWQYFYTAISS